MKLISSLVATKELQHLALGTAIALSAANVANAATPPLPKVAKAGI